METLLTLAFFGILGISVLSVCIYLSFNISGFIVDVIDNLSKAVPQGLVISKKTKNKGKIDPIPVDYIIAGSMF